MLGGKRRATYATKMFDEIDRRCERPTHRKPWALDREKNRNAIADRIARGGISHYRPVAAPVAPVIQDSAYHKEIRKVSEIRELHEIVARRRGELFQPHRRLHARQQVIGGDQPGVLPARRYEMHELSQFLKAK